MIDEVENVPLLAEQEEHGDDNAANDDPIASYAPRSKLSKFGSKLRDHLSRWSVIYLCGIFIFIIELPVYMRVAPSLRLIEQGVCRDYYKVVDPSVIAPNGDVDEGLCKLSEIQQNFARFRGLLGALSPIPGLFLAIPYGIMADRMGRRFVILLCCFGAVSAESYILMILWLWRIFPTTAIALYPLFLCVGGGGVVFAAIILTVVADVCPSHLRTRIFFGMGVMVLITELVAPPIGSLIMTTFNAYISYATTIPIRLLSFLFPLVIPETKAKDASNGSPEQPLSDSDSIEPAKRHHFLRKLDELLSHLRSDVLPLITRTPLLLGMMSLLIEEFARTQGEFLLQYMTIRFGWRYSQAAYLVSFKALVHIALLCTVLPFVHAWLGKRYGHPEKANLILAKGSVFFLILGPVISGLADKQEGIFVALVVFTLGSGFTAGIRSFLTSLVAKNETALLYTMLSVFANLGGLIGTPLIGLIFSAGIRKGGAAMGLPFFVGAALYFLSGLSVWFLTVPLRTTDEEGDENAEQQQQRSD